MVESGSSLFYLFHCSAHDRLNTMPFRLFRNTPHGLHPVRLDFDRRTKELCLSTPRTDCIFRAMWSILMRSLCLSTPRTDCILGDAQSLVRDVLCLSTPRTDCIVSHAPPRPVPSALPQHTPHGLHQQNRTDAMPQIHAICCELVDSFSDATKAASALTIFPRFSTVKAIYIAIIDSLGRTIDRFFGANRTEKIC